jgi:hypothetical protein
MRRTGIGLLAIVLVVSVLTAGCSDNSTGPFQNPPFDPSTFVSGVTNPFLPLTPGTINYYEGISDGAAQTDSVEVTSDTKTILGVVATVVHDRVYTDGELTEDTFDWFAQDQDGNVWYLGEDTKELENGQVVSTQGSWEAGVNGAEAGIIMWGDPAAHIGEQYRQEFSRGVAEDFAKVVAVDQSVTVPYGTLTGCVTTEDRSALEPSVVENKFYCSEIGVTLEQGVQGSTDRNELVAVVTR